MELRAGYKQTEAGVIPADWVAKPLLTAVRVASGQVDPRNEPFRSMVLVAPDHIESATGRLLNKVSAGDQHAISGKYLFAAGDIVYSKIRPYLRKAILADFSGLCSADMYPLKPAADVSAGFILASILAHQFSTYAESVSVRSGMPKINRGELAEYLMAFPPTKAEQEAIAEVLSDADALIESLDQLIAKKRQIKQGVMQELLTGKHRLPGFSGTWNEVTIKKAIQIPVTDGPHMTPVFLEDGVPFLSVNNLIDGKIDFSDLRYISVLDHEEFSKKCKPQKEDILLGKAASVGKVALVETNTEFNIWSPLALIRVNSKNHAKFVYYQLQSNNLNRQISLLTNSSSQGNIGMGDIEKLVLPLPDKDEQLAIATILSDMDTELAALEVRLAKAHQIKQGMMQELLTGRIRLL